METQRLKNEFQEIVEDFRKHMCIIFVFFFFPFSKRLVDIDNPNTIIITLMDAIKRNRIRFDWIPCVCTCNNNTHQRADSLWEKERRKKRKRKN